jgi:hypothetical protein
LDDGQEVGVREIADGNGWYSMRDSAGVPTQIRVCPALATPAERRGDGGAAGRLRHVDPLSTQSLRPGVPLAPSMRGRCADWRMKSVSMGRHNALRPMLRVPRAVGYFAFAHRILTLLIGPSVATARGMGFGARKISRQR